MVDWQEQQDSLKAMQWQKGILDKVKYSDSMGVKYKLDELMDMGEWPKVILPEDGWLGEDESVSFCGGEALVGLGVRNFKRLSACEFLPDSHTGVEEIKQKAEPEFIIPLTTMGELRNASYVQILPIKNEEFVYPTMRDLWEYNPRFAMPKRTFCIRNITVKRGSLIELEGKENDCVICKLQDQKMFIPMSIKGDFTIVKDENTYRLQEVYDKFTLPQRVNFKNSPPGLLGGHDMLLISELRYDVLIACCIADLHNPPFDDGYEDEDTWGSNEKDLKRVNFNFLPKPSNKKSPTAGDFLSWIYDPDDADHNTVMTRASRLEMDRFKDFNVVMKANTAAVAEVQEGKAENIYDYITIKDFLVKPPKPPDLPPPLPPGDRRAVGNAYSADPTKKNKGSIGRSIAKSLKKAGHAGGASKHDKMEAQNVGPVNTSVSDESSSTLAAKKPTRPRLPLPPLPNGTDKPEQWRNVKPVVADRETEKTPERVKAPASKPARSESPPEEPPPPRPPKPSSSSVVDGQVPVEASAAPRKVKYPPSGGDLIPLSELDVDQLAEIFTFLNLDDIAEVLKKSKVTGKFFEERLDANDFAEKPFNATTFQLKQIERIRTGDY